MSTLQRDRDATAVTVRRAGPDDLPQLAAVLARAFDEDPLMRWYLPRAERRVGLLERFYRANLEHVYLPRGEVYVDAMGTGAALWAPPGRWQLGPRELLTMAPAMMRFGRRALLGLGALARKGRLHPQQPPHFYLALLGVLPAAQRQGVGSALLEPVLAQCDARGIPAYVESSSERNLTLYERHGFRVTDATRAPRGPRIWTLWRPPRSARSSEERG